MKLLLDTHIWLWAVLEPQKLSKQVRRELERPKNEIYLSPISIWEAHQLYRRKRLRIPGDFHSWLDQALSRSPLHEAPFTIAVAVEASKIRLERADPEALLLAATASVFQLTLVTADRRLLDHRGFKTLETLANDE